MKELLLVLLFILFMVGVMACGAYGIKEAIRALSDSEYFTFGMYIMGSVIWITTLVKMIVKF